MAQVDRDHAQRLAVYSQNVETFRNLNSLMWQIPLIGMTLTGGLWFGVAKAEATPFFQLLLLVLTAAGDFGLIAILARLRYIVGRYLDWLQTFDPTGFVTAPGAGWWTAPERVRTMFQVMLGLAGVASLTLMVPPAQQLRFPEWLSHGSISFYDRQARDLADTYELLPFEEAHPYLAQKLRGSPPLRVLDVGSGTGRDAAWMSSAGHKVTAVEPSRQMLKLAKELHRSSVVYWLDESLPQLKKLGETNQYDLIVLSAVWMHVHPSERKAAMARLRTLLAPDGEIYLTLRSGPIEPERRMWPSSFDELGKLCAPNGLKVRDLGEHRDLLGRPEVKWRTAILSEGS